MLGNAGAHPVSYVTLNNGYRIMTTVYDIPAAHARIRAAFTNTMPTATYRGAGRPESHFVLERLIDMAALKLGLDRLEIRRRNLIRREQLPYRTAMGLTYDSGDFFGNMASAAALADWNGVMAQGRREETRQARRHRHREYVEAPVGAPHERVRVEVRDGAWTAAGTQSTDRARDHVRAGAGGSVRRRAASHSPDDRRHRRAAVGGGSHSDARCARRRAADGDVRRGRCAGAQSIRGARSRR